MQTFDWTYVYFGLTVYCSVSHSAALRELGCASWPLIRPHFEPIARDAVLKAGAAAGERWNFTCVGERYAVSRVDEPAC